jgi:hypothetical protein
VSSPSKPGNEAPERWSKALDRDDPLRGALRAARGERAPQRRLDRVFASVVAIAPGGAGGGELAGGADVADAAGAGAVATSGAHAIGKAAIVGKAAAASMATGSGVLAKAVIVGVFGATSVGTAWWISTDAAPPTPAPTAVVRSAAARAPTAAPMTTERPRAVEAAAPSAAPSSERPTPRGGASSPAVPDDRSEAALLREASAAVSSDPSRAIELVDEAERRFARGSLGQERELIRVQALIATGRREEAIHRARKLLARDPSTAHRPRLEKLLPELAN